MTALKGANPPRSIPPAQIIDSVWWKPPFKTFLSMHFTNADETTVNSGIVRDNFCLAKSMDETEPNKVLSSLSIEGASIGRKESELIGFGFSH